MFRRVAENPRVKVALEAFRVSDNAHEEMRKKKWKQKTAPADAMGTRLEGEGGPTTRQGKWQSKALAGA